jgi:hypothetical protein
MAVRVLVVTKGHPFDYNGFFAMFDDSELLDATAVEQPAAQILLRPEFVADYDAVFFYDMCATQPNADGEFPMPPQHYVETVEALLENGVGLVLSNHATVQWPGWPLWREISGTSFMLGQGELYGEVVPGSGYRGGGGEPERNARHRLAPVDPTHPVAAGLEDGFEIADELYIKTAGFERNPDIVPLFRSDYDFSAENFNPPPYASAEEQAAWDHPRGSDLITWAKRTGNSPVVVTEAGDGPEAYANPAFRRFLENALGWVASDEAKAWARGG